jgi:hypothetical protein
LAFGGGGIYLRVCKPVGWVLSSFLFPYFDLIKYPFLEAVEPIKREWEGEVRGKSRM